MGIVWLLLYLQDTRVMGRAAAGMITTAIGNTVTSAIFGVAPFAQPAMGHVFLAGQTDMLDFYDAVYGAPLFGTAIVGLLFFMAGGVFAGSAISGSGRLPKWAGWVYAISVVAFALSTFLLPVGQSVASPLLVAATATVALRAGRGEG